MNNRGIHLWAALHFTWLVHFYFTHRVYDYDDGPFECIFIEDYEEEVNSHRLFWNAFHWPTAVLAFDDFAC